MEIAVDPDTVEKEGDDGGEGRTAEGPEASNILIPILIVIGAITGVAVVAVAIIVIKKKGLFKSRTKKTKS